MVLDVVLVPLALYCAFALRFGTFLPLEQVQQSIGLFLTVLLVSPFVFWALRLPWIKLSTLDAPGTVRLILAGAILGVAAFATSIVLSLGSPRSIPGIFAIAFFAFSFSARVLGLTLMQQMSLQKGAVPVAIFGAGAAGIQLASALRQSQEVFPVCFVDDNPSINGLLISGIQVMSRAQLSKQIQNGRVRRVLIAIPSLQQSDLGELVTELSSLDVEIQVLPSYVDLISGQSKQLRTVSPDSLLGRDKVELDVPEIDQVYAEKTIMVTGAGGSIGSELCQQLLDCKARKIILFEQSEFALYEINAKIESRAISQNIEVVPKLGSVCDVARVYKVIQDEGVQIVLHAAAYKHVPLVERNEIEGARNNILGTLVVAEASVALGLERFILVSTDKAVRPTNVMGATKRLAELVVQNLAHGSPQTSLSIVRFGNVLGSSGSVIPLFQKQIRAGGPVTVTHAEVTRFFMTIPEASRLVLLAGAFSQGGEVFVLDMGEPIKIIEMARRMIEMSGAHIKSKHRPDGIELKVTGLRPGEKLYEELLIDGDNLLPTPHKKILKAQESSLSVGDIELMLSRLRHAIQASNSDGIRDLIKDCVEGYVEPDVAQQA